MHQNDGNCAKCDDVFDKYPGFHAELRAWFKALQKKKPEAHVSCAGRGYADQEEAFQKGLSRAHYGKSAHNFNAAIDLFRLTATNGASYDKPWFRDTVGTAVFKNNAEPDRKVELNWYGKPGASFPELPHIEVQEWKAECQTLVEPKPEGTPK
jgi:hypothetical protein